MSYLGSEQLLWIDVSPYDQVLTGLVSLCQKRETSLICVQGPNGSGKSRILTELLSSLSFDKTASLITLSGKNHEAFYHNVHISSKLLDLQNSEFLNNFILTLEAILEEKQHFYILIDDVEALPYELLQGMVQVILGNEVFKEQVTLVVFIEKLSTHINMAGLLRFAEVIKLLPMNLMETQEFVNKVYQYMKISHEISATDINRLHYLSCGYVGRILKLLESESVTNIRKKLKYSYYRLMVLCIIILLVGMIIYCVLTFFSSKKISETIVEREVEQAQSEIMVIKIEPEKPKKEEVAVKVILPIQTAAEYDAMNKLIEVKRLAPIAQEHSEEVHDIATQSIAQKILESPRDISNLTNVKETNYIIELGRRSNRTELENLLRGRTIPGKAQFKLINDDGSKVWVAYIGPYSSKKQAMQGQKKLPASLQQLPLKVNEEF